MLTLIIGALVVGITMGLLGSGGSAISVPLLVYVLGHSAKVSIAESMAIVGLIAFFAAIPYSMAKQVDWPSVVFFGIPGMIGTFIGAILGGLATDSLQLIVFGFVIVLAAGFMVRKAFFLKADTSCPLEAMKERAKSFGALSRLKMITEGLLVGVLTGFVGVGGGFLIVPALMAMAKLPIRMAIGTSLVIIAAKSLVGFLKYQRVLWEHDLSVDWWTILIFSVVGILASNLGSRVNAKLDQRLLNRVFAAFLVLIGLFVIIKECSGI
jgi:uncharacterized membrane protein YfcA